MHEYSPGRPLVFSHIPKCAGTSLCAALVETLHPSLVVRGVDLSLVGGYDQVEELSGVARAGVYLAPEDLPAEADLVAGHIAPATTQQRYPGSDHITILRNPRLRVLSQWMHSRAVSDFDIRRYGRAGDAFRAGRLPLREYLDHAMIAPNVDNTIARFLAWPHPALEPASFLDERDDEAVLAAALARLDGFCHVDVVENRGMIAQLAEWLGRELHETRLNERSAVPPKWRTDLTAELDPGTRELLDHRTRIDRRLWTRVAERTLPGVDVAVLLETSWEQSLERYSRTLRERRRTGRPVRRAVEVAYGGVYRLRHRDPFGSGGR